MAYTGGPPMEPRDAIEGRIAHMARQHAQNDYHQHGGLKGTPCKDAAEDALVTIATWGDPNQRWAAVYRSSYEQRAAELHNQERRDTEQIIRKHPHLGKYRKG